MPVPSNYINKGIWRGLIGALILAERHNKGVKRCGETYLNRALIIKKRYYIGEEIWRELFKAFLSVEKSGKSCLKLLY